MEVLPNWHDFFVSFLVKKIKTKAKCLVPFSYITCKIVRSQIGSENKDILVVK